MFMQLFSSSAIDFIYKEVEKVVSLWQAKDVIEEHGPSEKAINGPTSASGDEISKLQRTPGEEKINTLKEENTQEAAVLNGVS